MKWTIVSAALICAALCGSEANAGPNTTHQVTEHSPEYKAPIKADIDAIFGKLVEESRQAQALAADLQKMASKNPRDAERQVDNAAEVLGRLADTLQPNGQLGLQLTALRNAAMVHRKHVQDLPKDAIDEHDRSAILGAWNKVLQEADAATTTMADMRQELIGSLQELRRRQLAIGEFILAGQYEDAIKSLQEWLSNLSQTVNTLNATIERAGAAIHGKAAPTS
jgi:hypothetical protein